MKFGKWTVLGEAPLRPDKRERHYVRCECGTERIKRRDELNSNKSMSCITCFYAFRANIETTRNLTKSFKGVGEIGATEFYKITRNARLKGFVMDVTIDYVSELFEKQGRRCALTGMPLRIRLGDTNASLDRIDSNKGYIEGNVQWVDKRINMMKHATSQVEFIELCRLVHKHKGEE